MAHMRDARVYDARTGTRAYKAHARELRIKIVSQGIKWLLYTLCAVLWCILEHTSFALSSNGRALIPFLLPAWVTVIGMYEGYRAGAWFGIFAGLLSDAAGGNTIYLLPVLYMFYGLCAGLLGMRFLRKGFFVYLMYDVVVCIVHSLYRAAGIFVTALQYEASVPDLRALFVTVLWEMLAAVLWTIPLYLPAKGIRRLSAPKGDLNN